MCLFAQLPRFISAESGRFDVSQARGKITHLEEITMSKSQKRSNREQKKPKQEKPKTIAAAPSMTAVSSKSSGVTAGKKKK